MTVRLLFFSVLRDITGVEEIAWKVHSPATVGDLLTALYARWPALKEWDASLLVAVDQVYVKRAEPVPANAEVAIMPPVQGG